MVPEIDQTFLTEHDTGDAFGGVGMGLLRTDLTIRVIDVKLGEPSFSPAFGNEIRIHH